MLKRDLMQAEILLLLDQLGDEDLEKTLCLLRQKTNRDCSRESCDLTTAAETCRLLLTMDSLERKGYLRWVKSRHRETAA